MVAIVLQVSEKISPNFNEVFFVRAFRKFVYTFNIMNGVDTIYLSIADNQTNEVTDKCSIKIQSSSPNGFFGK